MRHTSYQRCAGGLLALLVGFIYAPPAWAGAWTVPKNRWFTEYFYRYFQAKKDFNERRDSTRKPTNGFFSDIRNELKFEYGLTDSWNLLASLPYQSSHYRDDNVDLLNTGVGDIYVRTKYRLLQQPIVTSVQFSGKIPSAYDPNVSPGLGDGQVDFESRLLLSRAFTYAPYQVQVRHSTQTPLPRQAPPSKSAQADRAPSPTTRDDAIRQAVMAAELQQQQTTKYSNAFMPEAEAATVPTPRLTSDQLEAEAAETMEDATAVETRYAGVAFVNLEGAFTARNEEPANEMPLVFEAGFTPVKRLMLVGSLESVTSIKSTGELPEDFAKWGLRAIFNVRGDGFASVIRDEKATLNVEVGYSDVFAGRNTADAFEVFGKVGVSF